jgi:DNA mismatch repair protein MSH5
MYLANVVSQSTNINYSILALAQGAKLYKLCRPRMTSENVVRINGGRSVQTYVAIFKDVDLDQAHSSGARSLFLRT